MSSEGINWPAFYAALSASTPNYFGPFTVITVDPTRDNVTIQLPEAHLQNRIHPTFHVSKLKPFHDRLQAFGANNDS